MKHKEMLKVCVTAVFDPQTSTTEEDYVQCASLSSMLLGAYIHETGSHYLHDERTAADFFRNAVSDASSSPESLTNLVSDAVDAYQSGVSRPKEPYLAEETVGEVLRFLNEKVAKTYDSNDLTLTDYWVNLSSNLREALIVYRKRKES